MWAALARAFRRDGIKVSHAKWVKAHQAVTDTMSPEEVSEVKGNCFVDSMAKSAAEANLAPEAQQDAHFKGFRRYSAFLEAASAMLNLWPPNRELYGDLVRANPAGPKTKSRKEPHTWRWNGASWDCRSCLRRKHTRINVADRIPCKGIPERFITALNQPNGHALLVSTTLQVIPLIFCSRCGKHASNRMQGIAQSCPGMPRARPYALVRLFSNPPQHPHTREAMTQAYHIDSSLFRSRQFEPSICDVVSPPENSLVNSFDDPDLEMVYPSDSEEDL